MLEISLDEIGNSWYCEI